MPAEPHSDTVAVPRSVAERLAAIYDAALSGLSNGVDVRLDASFGLQDQIGRERGIRFEHEPLALTVSDFHAMKAALSASPSPVGGEGDLGALRPSASVPTEQAGEPVVADLGREAIWKVVHEVWQLLDDGETDSAGITTIDQTRLKAVSDAMDALEALVPESAGPFWGGFPVNYLWPKGSGQ